MASEQTVWAVVDLFGRARMAGRLTEEERWGATLGRLDVPDSAGGFCTIYFAGSAVYRLHIVTEAVARQAAMGAVPAPVAAWDFPRPLPANGETIIARAVDDDPDWDQGDRGEDSEDDSAIDSALEPEEGGAA